MSRPSSVASEPDIPTFVPNLDGNNVELVKHNRR